MRRFANPWMQELFPKHLEHAQATHLLPQVCAPSIALEKAQHRLGATPFDFRCNRELCP